MQNGGNADEAENYKPISLLPKIGKNRENLR